MMQRIEPYPFSENWIDTTGLAGTSWRQATPAWSNILFEARTESVSAYLSDR
jgi:hypothetical protein